MSNQDDSTVNVHLSNITPASENEDGNKSRSGSSKKSPVFAGGWQLECSTVLINFVKTCRLDVNRYQRSFSTNSTATLVSARLHNEKGADIAKKDETIEPAGLAGWEKAIVVPWSTVHSQVKNMNESVCFTVQIKEMLYSSCIQTLLQHNLSLEVKLRTTNQVLTDPSGMDVVFVFPNGKELAASKRLLSEASEYFRSMFRSGCIEDSSTINSIVAPAKPNKADDKSTPDKKSDPGEGASSSTKSTEVETTDSQTTLTLVDNDPDSDIEDVVSEDKEETSKSVTKVPINNCQYKTFRAMLIYLMTGVIKFAPLRSTYRAKAHAFSGKDPELEYEGDITTVSGTEAKEYQERVSIHRASSKSVFVLADVYQMEDLKQCALQAFEENLTPENSIYELFTSCSERYEPIRSTTVKFILANWHMVRMTPAMENVLFYAARAGVNQNQAWKTIMGRLSVADPLT